MWGIMAKPPCMYASQESSPANEVSVLIGLLATLCLRSTFLKFAHSSDGINNGQCREDNINSYEQQKV